MPVSPRTAQRTLAIDVNLWRQLTDDAGDIAVSQRLSLTPQMVWRIRTGRQAQSARFITAVKAEWPDVSLDALLIPVEVAA